MKALIFVSVLLASFAFVSFVQDKNKPKATYQVGAAKVVVWENKSKDGSTWKNFEVEKEYMKDGEKKYSDHFNEKELLQLRAAIDSAIVAEGVNIK